MQYQEEKAVDDEDSDDDKYGTGDGAVDYGGTNEGLKAGPEFLGDHRGLASVALVIILVPRKKLPIDLKIFHRKCILEKENGLALSQMKFYACKSMYKCTCR